MPIKATVGIPIKLTTELANDTRRNHVNFRANSPLYSTSSDKEEEDEDGCSVVANDLMEEKRHRFRFGANRAIRLVLRQNMMIGHYWSVGRVVPSCQSDQGFLLVFQEFSL